MGGILRPRPGRDRTEVMKLGLVQIENLVLLSSRLYPLTVRHHSGGGPAPECGRRKQNPLEELRSVRFSNR